MNKSCMTQMTVNINNNNNCNKNNNRTTGDSNKKMSMSFQSNQMPSFDSIPTTMPTITPSTSAATPEATNASPPDFDFNLPCRYFKSSFARSLSLNNANNNNIGNNYCRSLDYEQRGGGGGGGGSNSKNVATVKSQHYPPFPQRLSRNPMMPATLATIDIPNDGSNKNCNRSRSKNEANCDVATGNSQDNSNKPPAIPVRRLPTATSTNNLEKLQQQQHQTQQQQPHQPKQQHVVPLTQFRSTLNGISHCASSSAAHFNKIINQQLNQNVGSVSNDHKSNSNINSDNNSGSSSSSSGSGRRNCVWPRDNIAGEQDGELSDVDDDDDAEIQAELTQISNNGYEQQKLQQHQQQQHHQHHQRSTFDLHHEDTVNVEAVLLQNQVDTLQWQLKQVETSCEMYRAVMEEVARFLDRYHSQKQQLQQLHNRNGTEQISRSKSMYHVYGGAGGGGGGGIERGETLSREKNLNCSDEVPATYLRARSSTNLIDLKQTPTTATRSMGHKIKVLTNDEPIYDVLEPVNTYNAFKDFTWRRSPKKVNESKILSYSTANEEKLNQEAFRLSRTIHNLLNTSTRQPDLTQHRNSTGGGRLSKTSVTASITTLHNHQTLHNSTSITLAGPNAGTNSTSTPTKGNNNLANANTTEMLFLRSLNMRDSRLSLRSSTDSSVHSTSSSSKVETDEEHHYHHPPHLPTSAIVHSAPKPIPQLGSTTEDESGFSSISSFQDIGVPLSSTMISQNSNCSNGGGVGTDAVTTQARQNSFVGLEFQVDSNNSNSTLKPPPLPAQPPPALPTAAVQDANNVVGVPLKATHDMQHRWDSPSKTYRNMPSKFQQRFSALSNDDSATVLWV